MTAILLHRPTATFVHIPKNAGTTIARWFMRYHTPRITALTGNHEPLAALNPQGVTIACVRNPWSRTVSAWSWFQGSSAHAQEFRQLNGFEHSFPSFPDFVLGLESWRMNRWFTATTNQWEWIPDGADILLRCEHLARDFARVQELTGSRAPLGHTNTSNHAPWRTYYTPNLVRRVGDIFAEDCSRFDYRFE